jgi:hypothetical protein
LKFVLPWFPQNGKVNFASFELHCYLLRKPNSFRGKGKAF